MDNDSGRSLIRTQILYPGLWYRFRFSGVPTCDSNKIGEIPWLFQTNFCDFHRYHLGFTVSSEYKQYSNASLHKRIVWTTCPDPFSSNAGVARPGDVCVTVTGHNRGSGIQHHIIPATHLKPANPTGKNQLCLVIKGARAGEVVVVKKCQKNTRTIVSHDEESISFDDVCLAYASSLL